MKLEKIKRLPARAFDKLGPAGLKIKAHSPEIKLAVGIGLIVGGSVKACFGTLKIEDIVEAREEKLEEVRAAAGEIMADEPESYSEDDLKKDVAIVHFRSCLAVGREFAPAVGLMAAGIFLVVNSHMELRSRLAAVTAAYSLMEAGFKAYRDRVRAELGEDADLGFRYGIAKTEIEETIVMKNGKEKTVKKTVDVISPDGMSVYARFWDQYNAPYRFNRSKTANRDFLMMALNACQDRFDRKGYLFLYEAYEALGLTYDGPITEGLAHTIGWVKGMGDDLLDFGYFLPCNKEAWSSEFGDNAKERALILDFNVDGVITEYV